MTQRIGRIVLAGLLAGTFALPATAETWHRTTSLIGESKYADAFPHYDYVNPDAPKGGTLNAIAFGTFDSFNPFIVRGTAAAGLSAFGGLLWDTLMQQSTDEPGTSHPLIAEAFTYPEDYSWARYRLNAEARWHDGEPITAEDVVWTFNMMKEHNQLYIRYFANVTEAVALGEREVEFRFDQTGNRELPHIMGDLVVLPKHWFEGTAANGRQRSIAEPTQEPPLGSGAYRIRSFRPGSEVIWERVDDYWGADLPVNVGRQNFDVRRYTYFLDDNAAWQAFTKGGFSDFRVENRAQRWATEYNFPAFTAGDVVREEFESGGGHAMQSYTLNARRPMLSDRRVRQALAYAFDFESLNRTLFYGLYTRTTSYFGGGDLASSALPEGRELEILREFEGDLPAELFTQAFALPTYDTPAATRENLRKAYELFAAAGWENRGGRLVNAQTGEPFRIEFLGDDPSDDRIIGPYLTNLRRLGVQAELRIVDPNQYTNRVRQFDYDVILGNIRQSQSPGNEQRDYWGSAAADAPGSRNYSGIKDPVVDKLIERIVFATDRDDLIAATRALDRVLLWNFYVVPQWHNPKILTARWDKFGIPENQPEYTGIDLDSWWVDRDKEAALASKYRSQN